MKKILSVLGVVFLSSSVSIAATLTGLMVWGYDGVERAKMWVSPDGRMSLSNLLDRQPTAWDLWPTLGIKPREHALSEITLHRCGWWETCEERISLAAMVQHHYRVSIEKGKDGKHKPLLFCFDTAVPGGQPYCPLIIDPKAGVIIQ